MFRRRFLAYLAFLLATLFLAPFSAAGQPTGLLFREVRVGKALYRYEVYVPPGWNAQRKWPVILFLHGAGHRGEYAPGQTSFVLGERFLSYWRKPNAIVVMPRCRTEGWWSDADMEAMALKALDQATREFSGDRQRTYLTGLSMGGYGTWYIASRYPGKFAAIAPICAGIRQATVVPVPAVSTAPDPYADIARKIAKTPVWVFHGSADDTIPVTESRSMVEALKAAGGNVRYTEYEGVGHNSWDRAYAEPDFFDWLLSQRLPARKPGRR